MGGSVVVVVVVVVTETVVGTVVASMRVYWNLSIVLRIEKGCRKGNGESGETNLVGPMSWGLQYLQVLVAVVVVVITCVKEYRSARHSGGNNSPVGYTEFCVVMIVVLSVVVVTILVVW